MSDPPDRITLALEGRLKDPLASESSRACAMAALTKHRVLASGRCAPENATLVRFERDVALFELGIRWNPKGRA
jgi:hypothetical protein